MARDKINEPTSHDKTTYTRPGGVPNYPHKTHTYTEKRDPLTDSLIGFIRDKGYKDSVKPQRESIRIPSPKAE